MSKQFIGIKSTFRALSLMKGINISSKIIVIIIICNAKRYFGFISWSIWYFKEIEMHGFDCSCSTTI